MSTQKLVDFSSQTYDSSSLGEFERCHRRAYYHNILGLIPKIHHPALTAGSQIHKCLAAVTLTSDLQYGIDMMLYDGREELAELHALPIDNLRHPLNLEAIMRKYYAFYGIEKPHNHKVVGVELDFALELSGGFTLTGVLDEIYKEENLIFIQEHKSTSIGPTDWFFKPFNHNLQILVYTLAMKTIFGRCDGVEIDGIRIAVAEPLARKKDGSLFKKDSDKVWFDRRIITPTTHALAELELHLNSICEFIEMGRTASKEKQPYIFFQNHNACCDYGGCPYIDLCQSGLEHPEFLFDQSPDNTVRYHEQLSLGYESTTIPTVKAEPKLEIITP